MTSNVLPAAMNTSVCTRGAGSVPPAVAVNGPGTGLPSSAIRVNPPTAPVVVADCAPLTQPVVCDPTMEGTCIRRPAFTRRTRTLPAIPVVTGAGGEPVTPAVAANSDAAELVLLNAV